MKPEEIEAYYRQVQCAQAQGLCRSSVLDLGQRQPALVDCASVGNVGQSPSLSFEEELARSL